MNDMLRSPHVSAHLHKRSTSLQPMHGRPRSHTAPSTPLAEASFSDPVELPGCPPLDRHLRASLEHAADGKSMKTLASASHASMGHSIERPHTSPQESAHPLIQKERSSLESLDRREQHIPYPFSPDAYRTPAGRNMTLDHHAPSLAGEDETITASRTASQPRPSLSVLQPPQLDTTNRPLLRASLPAPRRPEIPAVDCPSNQVFSHRQYHSQGNVEAMLMEQLSSMRASHEDHLASLKVAHEKEVESQKSYIEFLNSIADPDQHHLPPLRRRPEPSPWTLLKLARSSVSLLL